MSDAKQRSPMTAERRDAIYRAQRGSGPLTPAQRRRTRKKDNRRSSGED